MLHGYLKQATASQSRLVGPFLDDTDFKTAETGLTIANTDVKLSVAGAAGANKNSGGGTHRNNGMYSLTFDATDTATVGELAGSIVVAGALPVVFKFLVVEEAIYDALFAASATGYLQPTVGGRTLDVTATGEAGIDLANIGAPSGNSAAYLGALWSGTLSAIAATTVTLPGGHNLDHEGNYAIVLTGGTAAEGKGRYLTYSGAGEVWTVDPAWNSDSETIPSGSITAMIIPAPKLPTSAIPNVNTTKIGGTTQTARDIGASVIAASVTGNVGGNVVGSVASVTGNVSGSVASVAGNVGGNVSGTVASVVTKTGYSLAAAGLDAVLDAADGVETGFSLRGWFRTAGAALLGRETGRGTSTTRFKAAVTGAKTRVTSVKDSDNNRDSVTLDQT